MEKEFLALVVGASAESVFAIKEAQAQGFYVIAFDGDSGAEGLKQADESYVVDIRDCAKIVEILKDKIPNVILPVPIGRYLITTGFLNEYYGIKGPYKVSTDLCTDKYLFHSKLSQSGLRNIKSILFSKGETTIFENLEFPIIVKPRYGSGNREVLAIFSEKEFKDKFLSKAPYEEDFLIETLIQGVEYGIDGVVIDGEFSLVLLREKKLTPYPYSQCVGYYSVIEKDLIKKADTYLKEIIKLLKVKNSLLHADLMYKNGEFIVIELSLRPSGHYLHNNFTIKATGINVIKEYLKYIKDENFNFKNENPKNLHIRFFDFEKCKVFSTPDWEDLSGKINILDYKCNVKNQYMQEVKDGHSIMDRGYFILENESRKILDSEAQKILNSFIIKKLN